MKLEPIKDTLFWDVTNVVLYYDICLIFIIMSSDLFTKASAIWEFVSSMEPDRISHRGILWVIAASGGVLIFKLSPSVAPSHSLRLGYCDNPVRGRDTLFPSFYLF